MGKSSSLNKGRWLSLVGAALICGLGAIPRAQAAASAWANGDVVQARLVAAVSGTGDLKTIPLGLEVKLGEGWKTYWRSPGDAGLPPSLTWDGSTNFEKDTLLYPKPERMTLLGIQTFGYKHAVLFPIDVAVAKLGQPLDLKLKLDLLVCAELCIPKTFDLAMTIPVGTAAPDAEAQLIDKARAAVPTNERASGLAIQSIEEVSDAGSPAIEIKATAIAPFEEPDIVTEIEPAVALGAPRLTLSANRRAATFLVPLGRKLPVGGKLTGRVTTLTVVDGARALETAPRVVTQGASASLVEGGPSFFAMLAVALLGGLILNLMPCVLPVLSLKFISVVSQGGRAPTKIRAGFFASAAGIVVSFMAIAVALIAVKSAGRTIGWGIQFQEPAFIAGMAVLVTLFACHLAGLFEIPLPRFIANAASARTGRDESLVSHFVTGAFATLLATPCSAPFLGTAVGFAMAGGTAQMLGIFFALGVGLALPYLLIAAVPRLAARMPKPGRWMLILKKAMAIPLIATSLWLLSILASQVGIALAVGVAALLAVIIGLLALRTRLPEDGGRFVMPVVAVIGLVAVVLPDAIAANGLGGRSGAGETIAWAPFDHDKIRGLVSQGKTVFVDVTADWCLTCQANKRLVLSDAAMAERLNTRAVSMEADWTRPSPEIAAYLASYGRYGIPFNIVYGPGAPSGIVLPELLSTGDVSEALDKAAGEGSQKLGAMSPSPTVATAKDSR